MIQLVVRLIETLALLFALVSYFTVGLVAFFPRTAVPNADPRMFEINFGLRFLMWLISPIIFLDVLLERFFGWRLI